MRVGDDVRVVNNNEKYAQEGVYKDMIGYVAMPEIRNNSFCICFIDENFGKHDEDPEWFEKHYNELKDDIFCEIKIQDLELVHDGKYTDKDLLERLPKKDTHWWCKVEDGFIMNLNGDKKNKIPYDYDS